MIHNALNQITIPANEYTIKGFAISGLASYIQVPELDLCFDMGECPVSAISLNNVFLTHSHGDHSRCLLRHFSLRKMLNIPSEAHYYIPEHILEQAKEWVIAESIFEGVHKDRIVMPHFVGVSANSDFVKFENRKDLFYKGFPVTHSQPSLGYTIYRHKKKLRAEFLGLAPEQLIALRQNGTTLEQEIYTPEVTYIADCTAETLTQSHIWKSKVLLLESTFIHQGEESLAKARGHSHLHDVVAALELNADAIESTHIILKHFSMKYSKREIIKTIREQIPAGMQDLIHILL